MKAGKAGKSKGKTKERPWKEGSRPVEVLTCLIHEDRRNCWETSREGAIGRVLTELVPLPDIEGSCSRGQQKKGGPAPRYSALIDVRCFSASSSLYKC